MRIYITPPRRATSPMRSPPRPSPRSACATPLGRGEDHEGRSRRLGNGTRLCACHSAPRRRDFVGWLDIQSLALSRRRPSLRVDPVDPLLQEPSPFRLLRRLESGSVAPVRLCVCGAAFVASPGPLSHGYIGLLARRAAVDAPRSHAVWRDIIGAVGAFADHRRLDMTADEAVFPALWSITRLRCTTEHVRLSLRPVISHWHHLHRRLPSRIGSAGMRSLLL